MCPICESLEKVFIGKPLINNKIKKYIRREYAVVRCNGCGFYYVFPNLDLSIEEWKILYKDNYFPIMTKWHAKNRYKDRIQRLDKLSKFSSNPIQNFLDVGCGEGYVLLETVKRGWKSFGIDIVDNRVMDAKNAIINFKLSNLIEAKFPSDFFDCIYLDSVLEHLTNPMEYLTELNRILKKGGLLYIGVPNEDSLFNDVKKIIYSLVGKNNISTRIIPFASPYHICGFNKKTLRLAIMKSSFNTIQLRDFCGSLNFLNYKIFSKEFFLCLAVQPITMIASLIRKEEYLEAYIEKYTSKLNI